MHTKTLMTAILALLASAVAADAALIDFNSLNHGEVLTTQFLGSHGLTFSATNNTASRPDKVMIFDTMENGTLDPDLQHPWAGGNLDVTGGPDVVLDMVFCIPENDFDGDDDDDFIDNPDDERSGGTIFLNWDHDLVDISFAQVDMDEATANQRVQLYDDGGLVLDKSFSELFGGVPGVVFADHYANQLPLLSSVATFGKFDEMRLILTGSGAFDNIYTEVPEPATMGLLAIGGLAVLKRRRK